MVTIGFCSLDGCKADAVIRLNPVIFSRMVQMCAGGCAAHELSGGQAGVIRAHPDAGRQFGVAGGDGRSRWHCGRRRYDGYRHSGVSVGAAVAVGGSASCLARRSRWAAGL